MPNIKKCSSPFQSDPVYDISPLAITSRQIAPGRELTPGQESRKAKSQPE
jgi:hypothetical protein